MGNQNSLSASSGRKAPQFFQLLVRDDFTGERPGWYWQDDDCEEPMGPFESRHEAADDYRNERPFSSDGASNG